MGFGDSLKDRKKMEKSWTVVKKTDSFPDSGRFREKNRRTSSCAQVINLVLHRERARGAGDNAGRRTLSEGDGSYLPGSPCVRLTYTLYRCPDRAVFRRKRGGFLFS